MSPNDPNADNDIGVLLADRSRRALTEPLSVVTLDGTPVDDETVVSVVSHSGESHTVDVVEGRCTCKDAEYNLPDGDRDVCKHVERARVATGREVLDAAVIRHLGDEIDPQLGANADGPTVATADGGVVAADSTTDNTDEGDLPNDPAAVTVADTGSGFLVFEVDSEHRAPLGREVQTAKELIGFAGVDDWAAIRDAVRARGLGVGAVTTLPTFELDEVPI